MARKNSNTGKKANARRERKAGGGMDLRFSNVPKPPEEKKPGKPGTIGIPVIPEAPRASAPSWTQLGIRRPEKEVRKSLFKGSVTSGRPAKPGAAPEFDRVTAVGALARKIGVVVGSGNVLGEAGAHKMREKWAGRALEAADRHDKLVRYYGDVPSFYNALAGYSDFRITPSNLLKQLKGGQNALRTKGYTDILNDALKYKNALKPGKRVVADRHIEEVKRVLKMLNRGEHSMDSVAAEKSIEMQSNLEGYLDAFDAYKTGKYKDTDKGTGKTKLVEFKNNAEKRDYLVKAIDAFREGGHEYFKLRKTLKPIHEEVTDLRKNINRSLGLWAYASGRSSLSERLQLRLKGVTGFSNTLSDLSDLKEKSTAKKTRENQNKLDAIKADLDKRSDKLEGVFIPGHVDNPKGDAYDVVHIHADQLAPEARKIVEGMRLTNIGINAGSAVLGTALAGGYAGWVAKQIVSGTKEYGQQERTIAEAQAKYIDAMQSAKAQRDALGPDQSFAPPWPQKEEYMGPDQLGTIPHKTLQEFLKVNEHMGNTKMLMAALGVAGAVSLAAIEANRREANAKIKLFAREKEAGALLKDSKTLREYKPILNDLVHDVQHAEVFIHDNGSVSLIFPKGKRPQKQT